MPWQYPTIFDRAQIHCLAPDPPLFNLFGKISVYTYSISSTKMQDSYRPTHLFTLMYSSSQAKLDRYFHYGFSGCGLLCFLFLFSCFFFIIKQARLSATPDRDCCLPCCSAPLSFFPLLFFLIPITNTHINTHFQLGYTIQSTIQMGSHIAKCSHELCPMGWMLCCFCLSVSFL